TETAANLRALACPSIIVVVIALIAQSQIAGDLQFRLAVSARELRRCGRRTSWCGLRRRRGHASSSFQRANLLVRLTLHFGDSRLLGPQRFDLRTKCGDIGIVRCLAK